MTTRRPVTFFLSLALAGCNASAPSPPSIPAAPSASMAPSATAIPSAVESSPSLAINGAITVDPPEVQLDEPVSIRLAGFPPNHEVTVRATTVGAAYPAFTDTGLVRESEATFKTDNDGSVDVTAQAPISGSYEGANAMGLFWSMHETAPGSGSSTDPTPNDPGTPIPFAQYRYTLTAEVDGTPAATTTFVQDLGSPDVTATNIAEDGVYGQFYKPAGAGPFPAVIMLQGSSGGLPIRRPKLLAAHGYAVLALPYMAYTSPIDGTALPHDPTSQIPLDYFGKAITWLQSQPGVDQDRIGIYGHSLGGLVAMLVGARYPEIKSVIATSPVSITWDSTTDRSGFSFKGKPIPFVAPAEAERPMRPYFSALASGGDYQATIPAIVASLKADPAIAAAIARVEKINGPVLIATGTGDTQIPSVVYGEVAMDRLREHHFPYPYQHIVTPGAGHNLDVPFVDRSLEISQGGGTPEANELAGEAMWPAVLETLAAMR